MAWGTLIHASTSPVSTATTIAVNRDDHYLARTGISSQLSDEPEDPDRPHNLWAPIDSDDDFGPHGRFGARARRTSWQLWMTAHRKTLATSAAAAALGILIARAR
jgi:hypothetical protein